MQADARPYCLITGAAGGIGRALVDVFGSEGFQIVAIDRDERPGNMQADFYLQADIERMVNDEPYADELFSEIRTAVGSGKLKALINNAAIQTLGGTSSLQREDWRVTLDTNLVAPFLLTQRFLEELESANGSVVNISSIHASQTKANFVAYATSKAALSGMTRAMAVDLGHRIRVNAIEPAAIDTNMLRAGFENQVGALNDLEACHPRGRIGHPYEVARLAVMLVQEELDFIHGGCFSLDGGISNRLFDPD